MDVAEDRFEDLGPRPAPTGDEARGDAAERLAELDRERERERRRRAQERRQRGRYSWVVGVVFAIGLVIAGVNSIPNKGAGVRGPDPGKPAPAFAAPLATGTSDADANVKQDPAQPDALGKVPACQVRGRGVFNLCDATARRPLVLTFIVTRGARCAPQLDRVEQVRREFPGVGFAGVVSGDGRAKVARLASEHDWRFPVAVDRDGEVVNVYRIGVCPTTVFLEPGRTVRATKLGMLTSAELRAEVRALERAIRR
ncbi:MAG: redoxin domain-containing protein [Thermoleophilaceae bacterium]|nr:redoxin domain-containing protein [Thermoleophilaceae bacterium]